MNFICGLYLTEEGGKIKRNLITNSDEIELDPSTVNAEIIEFSELNFKPYALVVDYLIKLSEDSEFEDMEYAGYIDMEIFTQIVNITNNLVIALEEENPLHGLLTRTMLEDQIPEDDGSAMFAYVTKYNIINCLTVVMDLQFTINKVLNDLSLGREIKPEDEYDIFKQVEFTQICTLDKKLTTQYRFRSIINYYIFLFMKFIEQDPNVVRCKCCGRFFIPKTKKRTLYCDRVIKNGRTCKQVAPALKHKVDTAGDTGNPRI